MGGVGGSHRRFLVLHRTEERAESQLKLYGRGSIPLNRFVCFFVQYSVCLLDRLLLSGRSLD